MKQNRRLSGFLCTILVLTLAGCSSQISLTPKDALQSLENQLSFSDQMTEMDCADACRFYGLDTELVADGAAYVGSGATAENLVVFQGGDHEDAKTIAQDLQAFLNGWINGYSDYKPEEVPKLESAVLEQKDVYVILCVSSDNNAASDIIKDMLKG